MDIDEPTLPSSDEPGREDAHVATEHHQFHVRSFQLRVHKPFVGHTPLGLLDLHRQWHSDACDAGIASVLQPTGVGLVGEY